MNKYLIKKDMLKHFIISILIFSGSITLGLLSDFIFHLKGVVLVMITSMFSFITRYILLIKMGFNKERSEG